MTTTTSSDDHPDSDTQPGGDLPDSQGRQVPEEGHDHARPRRQAPPKPPPRRQASLVLVNTGHGKGKSTAAFGVVMRSVARGWRVSVVQFMKSGRWKVGEEAVGR